MANWYVTLAPRDQRVLKIGGVAVVLIVLVGVFLPLQTRLKAARAQLETQQQDLDWMRQVGPTLASAGPGPVSVVKPEQLLVLVDSSAREAGLAQSLTGSQPVDKGAVRVQLEHADFNMLAGWLARLSSQNGVKVESATVTGSNSPGVVNATVQLRTR
jgi:general secretion pathway protein M